MFLLFIDCILFISVGQFSKVEADTEAMSKVSFEKQLNRKHTDLAIAEAFDVTSSSSLSSFGGIKLRNNSFEKVNSWLAFGPDG